MSNRKSRKEKEAPASVIPSEPEKQEEKKDQPKASTTPTPREKPQLFGVIPAEVSELVGWAVRLFIFFLVLREAYQIRIYAIEEYGLVIHEFDPWFNYRATEYLEQEGWSKFFSWFDYMVWYPLGRPVGTTIYPGMQITSVFIYRILNLIGYGMPLNDVCCYVPAWFGVTATIFLALLTYECSKSPNAALIAASIFAISPAHIMRSVGGGYDNESIAMTAMCMTFYFWCRSLRDESSWIWGIATGLAYIYMVAAWGGFIFVLNLIGAHAALLMISNFFRGVHDSSLHKAYTLFYAIGTAGAVRVPIVGWTPFKSLEQIAPLILFCGFQLLEYTKYVSVQKGYKIGTPQDIKTKIWVFSVAGAVFVAGCAMLYPTGFFGPISSRVRGLFLKHTRTGNPLVDSVAEHQPASNDAYWHYLHMAVYTTPIGFALLLLNLPKWRQASFLFLYGYVAYYFSMRMVRLILLAGPISSALSGIGIGYIWDWCFHQLCFVPLRPEDSEISPYASINKNYLKYLKWYNTPVLKYARLALVVFFLVFAVSKIGDVHEFRSHCDRMAHQFSHPQIMYKARLQDGTEVLVDDYREAYFWLRDKTPPSSRVMSWWDYGYQITGIGHRTTIADGNTWNHEHIATLGYCLTSPVKRAHSLIRHLADYVLVWAGGGGDDLAKSPHMARIGNSVYNDVCPGDPTCSMFGFFQNGKPTPMMEKSLLYNLVGNRMREGVKVDESLFSEAYRSKHGLVRIYKVMNVSAESKKWVADPANRKCDAPGSWYCPGQYPPAEPLQKLFAKKRDFKQLEDFNKGEKNNQYHKEYMDRMEGRVPRGSNVKYDPKDEDEEQPMKDYSKWEDNEFTTQMWKLIAGKEYTSVEQWIKSDPGLIHLRSADGRGPLWWAYENNDKRMIKLLHKLGAKKNEKDSKGLTPKDLAPKTT